MPDLWDFQKECAIEILEQVRDGKRPEMLMDTILKLKVEAIVQLGERVAVLERQHA